LGDIADLPAPALVGEFQKLNAATAMVAFQSLVQDERFPVSNMNCDLSTVMSDAMKSVDMIGRFQILQHGPDIIVDVAHNPQAAEMLASQLSSQRGGGYDETWAIVAMLSDKDVASVIGAVSADIDHWCLAGLDDTNRGLSTSELVVRFAQSDVQTGFELNEKLESELGKNQCTILSSDVMATDTVAHACKHVLSKAQKGDRIIIFGSFYTVAGAIEFFQDSKR
jgi:dihydrofolate synthase/folylpolyglutamate synthase